MIAPFQLDKRNARIMGVAAGVAAATDIDVLVIRIAVVNLALTVALGWGVALYLLVGLCAPVRPLP